MEIPVYKIIINEEDETGCTTISLVDKPAVEIPFLCFDEEKSLFKADDDKHIISGIAMLANTPIYRRSPSRGEYYIVFDKETIRKMVSKYAKNQLFNFVNLQHDQNTYVNSCYMIESMIIDKERGIAPVEFSDVEDGSWYVSFYVEDEKLWNEIKNGNHLNGFSIEILSELELITENTNKYNYMNKFFKLAKAILKLEEITTDKETLIIDGELEVGKPVFVETEEGPVEAPDGEYKLEDETVVVVEAGLIAEIRPVEAPEELEDENPEEPKEVDPRIAELEAENEALKKEIELKDAEIADLKAQLEERVEELDEANKKLKMSVETPIKKQKLNNVENKALKYFN